MFRIILGIFLAGAEDLRKLLQLRQSYIRFDRQHVFLKVQREVHLLIEVISFGQAIEEGRLLLQPVDEAIQSIVEGRVGRRQI